MVHGVVLMTRCVGVQDEQMDLPDMELPDTDGMDEAEGAVAGGDVKEEEDGEQSGGFAKAEVKEKNKSGVNKLSEIDDWRAMRDAAAAQEAAEEAEVKGEGEG